MEESRSPQQRARHMQGWLIAKACLPTLGAILLLELSGRYFGADLDPLPYCLVTIALATFLGGSPAGFISAFFSALYSLYFIALTIPAGSSLWIGKTAALMTMPLIIWLVLFYSKAKPPFGQAKNWSWQKFFYPPAAQLLPRTAGEHSVDGQQASLITLLTTLGQELQVSLDAWPMGVVVKDRQGVCWLTNAAFAKNFGISVANMIGRKVADFVPDEVAAEWKLIDEQVCQSGQLNTQEVNLSLEGRTHTLQVSRVPLLNQAGEIIGITALVFDVSERQRLAEHLEYSRVELRALTAQLQTAREQERLHVAREIHDELGQILTGLKIDIVGIDKRLQRLLTSEQPQMTELAGDLIRRAKSSTELVNSAILTVRKISTELRAGLLDEIGLLPALEWQTEEFQRRTGIQCRLAIASLSANLDQERSTALFRICQEILTNTMRHAQATELTLSLNERDGYIFLHSRDNGRGIRAGELSNANSFGLLGMRERARVLGGVVSIKGMPNQGTEIKVQIPIA